MSKTSYGEFLIEKILKENNIPYEKEFSFDTCRYPDTNTLCRFDFYVNKQYIIEFDGEQHFSSGRGWNTEDNFRDVKNHDKYKNNWCQENNILLIRIPYTHINDIILEDLQINTSKFIVKGE